jgi:hypothetical protein
MLNQSVSRPKARSEKLKERAIMRPAWLGTDCKASVVWSSHVVDLSLWLGIREVFLGLWQPAVRFNDKLLSAKGGWRETCWVSDDDADYLELALDLSHGFRLERHFLLARNDRVLFMADALLGDRRGQLAFHVEMPLAEGVRFRRSAKSGAAVLLRDAVGPLAAFVPLAGQLSSGPTEAAVCLDQSASGRSLFSPVWIDLDPRRIRKRPLWRKLTVAQNRVNVENDVAVAYRIQVADCQWFLYRSLGRTAPRTALGQHLATEFALGPFAKDGAFTKWIEIE